MKIYNGTLLFFISPIPVSYTHLDVYKRQILYQFTGEFICAGHEWFLLSGKCVWDHWRQEFPES